MVNNPHNYNIVASFCDFPFYYPTHYTFQGLHTSEAETINNIFALPQYALRVNIFILMGISGGVEWGREFEAARQAGTVLTRTCCLDPNYSGAWR